MKVSVVGCGNISKCHFAALEKINDVEISSVVDIVPDRADTAAEKYNCKAYYDYLTMLDEDKPDCVHICTPHYLHVDMAVEALNRGINVLCEKPCAISAEGLKKLRLAQLMSQAQYGVCFQNRYNYSTAVVKSIVEKETYGKIKTVRAIVDWERDEEYYSDDWHGQKAKEGGGVGVNQSVHTLDLMTYLIGKKYIKVTGHAFNDHLKDVIEVEDTICARYIFEDGIVALFNATTGFGTNSAIIIDIFFEKALVRIEGDDVYLIKENHSLERFEIDHGSKGEGKGYWGNGHLPLINDFYDCLVSDRKFPIDAIEGGKSVEQFLAVYESSETGNEIVF
ncbi:MAG: Gfo/Idh/MocA family oxidoreductase [Ruminococcus sp.]|nr:Gfo/Idh/MocA family oxidoreductase [Candidatus Copronaster equi]